MKRFKIILLIIIALQVISLLCFAQRKEEKNNSPQMVITPATYDFGKMRQQEKVSKIFKIKNAGKKELVISRIQTFCGCTATMLSKDNLGSGETGELEITFQSGRRCGRVVRVVIIHSNDPVQPTKEITIYAEVLKPEEFDQLLREIKLPAYVKDLNPKTKIPKTLNPKSFSQEVKEAYKIAKEIPEILIQLPLMGKCGKKRFKSLLHCFTNKSAAKCVNCRQQASRAYELYKMKLIINKIRERIIAEFGKL